MTAAQEWTKGLKNSEGLTQASGQSKTSVILCSAAGINKQRKGVSWQGQRTEMVIKSKKKVIIWKGETWNHEMETCVDTNTDNLYKPKHSVTCSSQSDSKKVMSFRKQLSNPCSSLSFRHSQPALLIKGIKSIWKFKNGWNPGWCSKCHSSWFRSAFFFFSITERGAFWVRKCREL